MFIFDEVQHTHITFICVALVDTLTITLWFLPLCVQTRLTTTVQKGARA